MRRYSKLEEVEFNGIVTDEIYFSRTMLGTILNALPREHQEGYLAFLGHYEPGLLRQDDKIDIDAALRYAIRYLKFAIIKPAEFLAKASTILRQMVPNGNLETIGFANGDNTIHSIDWIQPQLSKIGQYLSGMQERLQATSEKATESLSGDDAYQGLFEWAGLPMSLKQQENAH